VRPIGDWSISITLSQNSRPVTLSCGPAITRAPLSVRAAEG
jgi:hypothetical protein